MQILEEIIEEDKNLNKSNHQFSTRKKIFISFFIFTSKNYTRSINIGHPVRVRVGAGQFSHGFLIPTHFWNIYVKNNVLEN